MSRAENDAPLYIRRLKRLLLVRASTLENIEIPFMLKHENFQGIMLDDLTIAIVEVDELFKWEKTHD